MERWGNSLQHVFVGFAYGTFLLETGDDGCAADFVLRSPTRATRSVPQSAQYVFGKAASSRQAREPEFPERPNLQHPVFEKGGRILGCLTIVQMR